jgi:hypothetical protein
MSTLLSSLLTTPAIVNMADWHRASRPKRCRRRFGISVHAMKKRTTRQEISCNKNAGLHRDDLELQEKHDHSLLLEKQ